MNIKKCRRILSLLLCVMLILSSMSIPVFAEEAGGALHVPTAIPWPGRKQVRPLPALQRAAIP